MSSSQISVAHLFLNDAAEWYTRRDYWYTPSDS